MRDASISLALLLLVLALPAWPAKLIEPPPPPPMPDAQLEEDGSIKKPTPAASSRGQQLYENHCMGCHESVQYIRGARQIRSHSALRSTVARWAANTNLPWGDEEIEEVARYLDSRYYRFEQQSNLK